MQLTRFLSSQHAVSKTVAATELQYNDMLSYMHVCLLMLVRPDLYGL